MASLRHRVAAFLPAFLVHFGDRLVFRLRKGWIRSVHRFFAVLGLNVVKRADYYSTLPVLTELEKSRARWDRPSDLPGVDIDVPTLQKRLEALGDAWQAEYDEVAGDHVANTQRGFGPGYPEFDARTLYFMLREHKPRRYLEVGSGLSTFYASLAAARNAADGSPLSLTCVEPYPFDALKSLDADFTLVESIVQDVDLEVFAELEAGDVLFIDSSHAFKIDSDVAYLFTEVLPRVKPGVYVHIHDVHFPFNGPYPADFWLFGERWPVYWNEAMLVQVFLAHNSAYRVLLSTPMLRHADEQFLIDRFPGYTPLAKDSNPPSSLWLQRV
ncbi:class I SAM-dependent methyltransferase [Nocardioides limicola]|uniref:class I SAM-dependent methyltransferase n=1 Tax=Nocardioides limicola TaxID=2803368 RepID=UPI00193B23DA|nr:class I SAM-dependent methyltransferase [Nocardioides sp. DJM-14]